ncbi:MAG TPA: hypothetical protein VFZ22_01030 [Pyrinomonadaceae bacterium]|nr:hypothetical protein [Pyrinomonadaceae bacterium]
MRQAQSVSWLFGLSFLLLIGVPTVHAQDVQPSPSPTPLPAPPPIRVITKEERSQIDQAGNDAKQRLRTTIQLASARLTRAEQHTSQGNYDSASAEVGSYHALIQDALEFLSSMKRDSNKTRDLYKRLELALRSDGPRLTTMRRTTPLEYAVWIKKVEEFARESRTEALNSFYGHTVVREKNDNDKTSQKPSPTPTPKSDQP